MIKGITESGFEFCVDERILEDWRFVSVIADTMDEDETKSLLAVRKLVGFALGEKGEKELCEFISNKNDGFVPAKDFISEVKKILDAVKELKNSSSSQVQ